MVQFFPALSILFCFFIITLIILVKIKAEQIPELLGSKSFLIIFVSGLFIILLIVHMFKEQSWTADLLKVVAGVLTGAVAALNINSISSNKESVDQLAIGNDIQQAGRDIHNIKKMIGDLKNVTDSVVNQYHNINQSINNISKSTSLPVVKQMYFHKQIPIYNEHINKQAKLINSERPNISEADDKTRKWYNRKNNLILSMPNVNDLIIKEIKKIELDNWHCREIQFDIMPDVLNISFNCEQRISFKELLSDKE